MTEQKLTTCPICRNLVPLVPANRDEQCASCPKCGDTIVETGDER